jgi:hypothetical protein
MKKLTRGHHRRGIARGRDDLERDHDGGHRAAEHRAKWGTNLSDLVDRQPLLLGAMGLAIGAAIASSIPTTEAKKKVMGETSDFIRDTVTEKAAQVKDMADAALQEVKAQGLTPEAAGEALHTLGRRSADDFCGPALRENRQAMGWGSRSVAWRLALPARRRERKVPSGLPSPKPM